MVFQTNFKEPRSGKIDRHNRRVEAKSKEDAKKAEVRRRDRGCRFPECGCKRYRLRLEVSHSRHKGMGGNPAGDRSEAALMVQLCDWRHQRGRIAVDRGTLRWRAQTDEGANGPIAWEVDGEALQPFGEIPKVAHVFVPHGWIVVATERSIGVLQPLEDWQRVILHELAKMSR